MARITEGNYKAEWVQSDRGAYSYDNATLISGQNLLAGAVLGQITASGKYTAVAPAASDGSQTAAGILLADTNATSADKPCVVGRRGMEAIDAKLGWGTLNSGQKTTARTQLNTATIVVRTDTN